MGKVGQSNRIASQLRQRGIGVIGAMALIAGVSAVAIFAMTAAPMYMNHMTVMQIAKDVVADESMKDKPVRMVKNSIGQRFRTNSLWDLDPEEVIKVRREKGTGLVLQVDYEVRSPLIYNMELVTHFSEENIGLN